MTAIFTSIGMVGACVFAVSLHMVDHGNAWGGMVCSLGAAMGSIATMGLIKIEG